MLTKTKEKKDKVNELLQRGEKNSVFYRLLSQKSFCLPSLFLFHRFRLLFFWRNISSRGGKKEPLTEDCKIKLRPVCNCNAPLPLSERIPKQPEQEIERNNALASGCILWAEANDVFVPLTAPSPQWDHKTQGRIQISRSYRRARMSSTPAEKQSESS